MNDIDNTWSKCARLLLLNKICELLVFQQFIGKIFDNIIENQDNLKFRKLKYANNVIKTKILNVSGALEFLLNVGFEIEVEEDGEKLLHFKFSDECELPNFLSIIKQWLNDTLSNCEVQSKNNNESCADCVLNIKLPTGYSVYGGFMKHEKLIDVLIYACCYFKIEKINEVYLISPITRHRVTTDELDSTLEDMKMCPRAVILTSTLSQEDSSELLIKSANEAKSNIQKEAKKIMLDKNSQKYARQVLKEEKVRILNEFKDDRNR